MMSLNLYHETVSHDLEDYDVRIQSSRTCTRCPPSWRLIIHAISLWHSQSFSKAIGSGGNSIIRSGQLWSAGHIHLPASHMCSDNTTNIQHGIKHCSCFLVLVFPIHSHLSSHVIWVISKAHLTNSIFFGPSLQHYASDPTAVTLVTPISSNYQHLPLTTFLNLATQQSKPTLFVYPYLIYLLLQLHSSSCIYFLVPVSISV